MDRSKTALEDGFVSYEFQNGEIFDFKAEAARAGKRVRDTSALLTSVHLSVIPVVYQEGALRADLG